MIHSSIIIVYTSGIMTIIVMATGHGMLIELQCKSLKTIA